MEWILTAIIAPLVIAGVVAVFRLRGMVWLVSRPLVGSNQRQKRLFQSITIWNGGGQAEEEVTIRFPDRLNIELVASTDGIAVQSESLISISSLPSRDRCQLLVLSDDEIDAATALKLRSRHVTGSHAKSEKDVATAAGLGFALVAILVLGSIVAAVVLDVFDNKKDASPKVAAEAAERAKPISARSQVAGVPVSWPDWESVDDFGKSELAKYYPSPSFPITVGDVARAGDIVKVPVAINNVTEFPINFMVSLSSSDSSDDPEPWKRRTSVRDFVAGPVSQRNVPLSIYSSRKNGGSYIVLEAFITYGDEIHRVRRNLRID